MAPTTGQPSDDSQVTDSTPTTNTESAAPAVSDDSSAPVKPKRVARAPKVAAETPQPAESPEVSQTPNTSESESSTPSTASELPVSAPIERPAVTRPAFTRPVSRPSVATTARRPMNGPVRAGQPVRQHGGQGNQGNRSNRLNLNTPDEVRAPRAVDGALQPIKGFVDVNQDGHAVIRVGFSQSRNDAYLSIAMVRKLGIRPGDVVEGVAREPRENDRYWGLKELTSVNGKPLSEARNRRRFEDLVPVYPKEKIVLETGKEPVSTRLIDLVAPIGKGQRGLIVSPPKAGKTTIMKEISTGIAANFPGVHLMAVLIGERPEEVTDIARHISAITDGKGETAASNFDEPALEQTRVAEVALERAKRLVELGQDVVIVMDSITRLARAYNLAIPTSGRTLSGGFDPAALYPPKRFFGAARNFEEGGSLTIIATALVDTGSRMDDLVYEEFKGTGNMELHLDRRIAERRIYPAINVQRSGTRRDDLLFTPEDYQSVVMMHRMMDMLDEEERTAMVVRRLKETNNNKQFLASLKS